MKTKWMLALALALVVIGLTGGVTIAQVQHNNGLGQSYVNSSPVGQPGNVSTYNLNMANAAANAWPTSGTISPVQCRGPLGRTTYPAVFKQGPTACAVWAYTGPMAGHVHANGADNNCYCPAATDPPWN